MHDTNSLIASKSGGTRGRHRSSTACFTARRLLLVALGLTLGNGLRSEAVGQTLAPTVQSAYADPAQLGTSAVLSDFRDAFPSQVVPAATQASVPIRASEKAITYGIADEGKILNMTEGEDRIVDTSDEPPPGFMTANQVGMPYGGGAMAGPGAAYGEYGLAGGAYSGAAPYGAAGGNPCCPENCHDWYISYEAVYLKASERESYTLSPGSFLGQYDFDLGGRYTFGQMLDCVDGVEAVYTGPFEWERARAVQAQTGTTLRSVFFPGGGYVDSQLSTFNNSFRHFQYEKTDLQSYEANRRWFAWDIMSTLIGFRAVRYNEVIQFDTSTSTNETGSFGLRTENFLLGGQIGADVMRPIGQRLSVGTKTRLGLFANVNKGQTFLQNAGNTLINASDRDVDFAGLLQYAAVARYRLGRRVAVIGGYEGWILGGIATLADQVYAPVTPLTGTSYEADDFVFFHGATGGVEISW